MKKIFFILFFIINSQLIFAQNETSEEESVKAVIVQMFDAMRESDTIKLKAVFHESARFQSAYINRNTKKSMIHTEDSPAKFVTQVGTPHDQIYDERILSYEIRVDKNMATVWTPYEFYLGEKFSHCGVNAFQLFKSEEGWKIVSIIDTRRRTGCK